MKYGTVGERLRLGEYLIELGDGYIIKRHYNELRACEVPIQNPLKQTAALSFLGNDHS